MLILREAFCSWQTKHVSSVSRKNEAQHNPISPHETSQPQGGLATANATTTNIRLQGMLEYITTIERFEIKYLHVQ
jgi:hypothetical protein